MVHYHHTADVCDGLPGTLAAFPKRALILARSDEKVILPEGSNTDEVEFLRGVGFGIRRENIVFVNGVIPSGIGRKAFPMSGCSKSQRQRASAAGLEIVAPNLATCLLADSKVIFQQVINRLGLRPRGDFASLSDEASIARLLEEFGTVRIKGPHSASGLQQQVISDVSQIDFEGMPSEVIVQEQIEGVLESPSAQIYIKERTKDWKVLSFTRQILDEKGHHLGNYSAVFDPQIEEKMLGITAALMKAYIQIGFWGPCGVDFLHTEEDVFPCEFNARVPAPWYPWEAIRRRCPNKERFFFLRSYGIPTDIPFRNVLESLGEHLFDPSDCTGILPFCFLPEYGHINLVHYVEHIDKVGSLADFMATAMSSLFKPAAA